MNIGCSSPIKNGLIYAGFNQDQGIMLLLFLYWIHFEVLT
jgi:hypothetical protein